MSVLANNLRPNTQGPNGFASSPLFDLIAKAFSNAQTACRIVNDKSPNNHRVCRLKMPFDERVYPAYKLTAENSSQGYSVRGTR